MPCPNDLNYWNVWDAVNMAVLKQPDDIRQPQIWRFLFLAGMFQALREKLPQQKQNSCLAGMMPTAWE